MPIDIERFDTEIEILPGSSPAEPAPRAEPARATTAAPLAPGRRDLLAALEAELEDYTRMRG
jgi:hypothetical protein